MILVVDNDNNNAIHNRSSIMHRLLDEPSLRHSSNSIILDLDLEDPALVESSCLKPEQQPQPQQPRQKVRFGSRISHSAPSSHEDIASHELWYTPVEFQSMRINYKYEIKRLSSRQQRRRNSQEDQQQPQPLAAKAVFAQTFDECLESAKNHSCSMLSITNQTLSDFYVNSVRQCPIGLERTTSKRLFQDKYERRQRLVAAVLEQQQRLNQKSSKSQRDADLHASLIRLTCENMTLPSVLFAHQIAVAAAEA